MRSPIGFVTIPIFLTFIMIDVVRVIVPQLCFNSGHRDVFGQISIDSDGLHIRDDDKSVGNYVESSYYIFGVL